MQILKYKPNTNAGNALKGWVTLQIPKWGDFIIEDIQIFEKGDRRWINLPSRQYEDNGEKKYHMLNRFAKPDTLRAFTEQVLKAVDEHLQTLPQPEQQLEIPF